MTNMSTRVTNFMFSKVLGTTIGDYVAAVCIAIAGVD